MTGGRLAAGSIALRTMGGTLPPLDQGLLLAIARLGVTNVWVRGDSIFNIVQVPQLFPGNKALVHRIGGWHALAANAASIVAGLHSPAPLFHHLGER